MEQTTSIATIGLEESVSIAPPALELKIENEKIVAFVKAYIKKAKAFYKDEKKLDERRKRNKKYYFGRQKTDKRLNPHGIPYLDNVIKEGEDVLRPLVLSRLPEFVVKPGNKSDESELMAVKISEMVNKEMQSRQLKKVLTKAFRHHPIYYTGVIKYRWDPNKGKLGGVVFEVIHPDNILVDNTATENNQEVMKIIVHYVKKAVKEWILMFPKKEKEIIAYARKKGAFTGNLTEEALAADLKIPEIWFDWFKKGDDFDGVNNLKFDFFSGVCWKMGDELLDKTLNPNWDWEGSEEMFFNDQPIPEEQLSQISLLGLDIPGIETKRTFRNFFGKPRKPFIFLGYEQYGEMAYDETSRIEENISLQKNYDIRGMQVTTMINEARGKHIFSELSGLKKETVSEMDLNDPNEDIVVKGKLRDVHAFLKKEQPSEAMFADLTNTRGRMMARIHISAPTRGEITTSVATTNQIARESDFNVADDISDLMINDAATQMAEALLHMMKLRFTEEHFIAALGQEGAEVFNRFVNDIDDDGVEVEIFASGTDKLKAERQAKEEAALGLIDPVSYFKDTGRSDPEGRAEKMFLWETNKEMYFERYIKGNDLTQVAAKVEEGNQVALQNQGLQPPTQQPSPQDTTNIATTPQGSTRGFGGVVSKLFNR